jgi:hypothetical protein
LRSILVSLAATLALGGSGAHGAEFQPASAFAPPPESLDVSEGLVRFLAPGFAYETADGGSTWTVERSREVVRPSSTLAFRRFHTDTTGAQTIFQCVVGRDEARLSVIRYAGGRLEPVGDLTLYDRWAVDAVARREAPRRVLISPGDTLPKAPDPAPALLTPVHTLGFTLWLGIGWQEARLRGVGGLVRYDLATRQAGVHRTPELERGSVVRLALVPNAVWLALELAAPDGAPSHELLRFDPATLEVTDFTHRLGSQPARIPILAATGDTVWAARGAFVARAACDGRGFEAWRIFPRVRLALRDTVSSLPGRPSSRAASSGHYEVLGGTRDSLLILTRDGVEGWLAPGADSASATVLRETPAADGTMVARFPPGVPVEPIALRTAEGWQRARVRAGWIARGEKTPTPTIEEVSIAKPSEGEP